MTQVGWIGTGNMGGEMVKRLAREGFELHIYNRTRAKAEAVADAGAVEVCDSPKEVAEKSDVVFTSLTNDAAILEVLEGDSGVFAGCRKGQILVDVSTIGPEASQRVKEALEAHGMGYVGAPVQGSMFIIAKGFLSVLCSGKRAAYEEVLPVLTALGKRATFYGEGHESRCVKISNNMLVTAYFTLVGEVLAVGEALGLPWDELVARLSECLAGSRMLSDHGNDIVTRTWQSKAALTSTALKDLSLACELAYHEHFSVPVTALVRSYDQFMHGHASYTTYSSYGTVAVLEALCAIEPKSEPEGKEALYKMLGDALLGMQTQLFAEACVLSEKYGVEWNVVLKDLLDCFGASNFMKEHAGKLESRDFGPGAMPAKEVADSLQAFVAEARACSVFTPIAEVAAQRINALLARDVDSDIFALVPLEEFEAGVA